MKGIIDQEDQNRFDKWKQGMESLGLEVSSTSPKSCFLLGRNGTKQIVIAYLTYDETKEGSDRFSYSSEVF